MAHLSVAGDRGGGQTVQLATAKQGVVAGKAEVDEFDDGFWFPSAGSAAISGELRRSEVKLVLGRARG